MTDAAKSRSAVESNPNPDPNPLEAFALAHPGAIRAIAIWTAAGAAVGIGIGVALPGRGAWYRAAVALLTGLGCALIGGLIAGVGIIPSKRHAVHANPAWTEKVDAKMKADASSPVPRRVSTKQGGSG